MLLGEDGAEKPASKDMFYYRKEPFIYGFYNA